MKGQLHSPQDAREGLTAREDVQPGWGETEETDPQRGGDPIRKRYPGTDGKNEYKNLEK